MKLKDTYSLGSYDKPRQHIKNQRHYFANKGPYSQSCGFPSSHVWIWELDHEEDWALKNWCFQAMVLKKTLESPLDCKEIKPVNPKGNQSWTFIGRTDAEAPILWPSDTQSQLTGKDPAIGKDLRQEEKGRTEDEMVGWNHWLNGHKFVQAPGGGEGQGSLACCSPWDHTESDTTEWLNNSNKTYKVCCMLILLKISLNLILLSAYELFFLWPPFVALVCILCTLYGRHWFLFLCCSSFTKVPEMSCSRALLGGGGMECLHMWRMECLLKDGYIIELFSRKFFTLLEATSLSSLRFETCWEIRTNGSVQTPWPSHIAIPKPLSSQGALRRFSSYGYGFIISGYMRKVNEEISRCLVTLLRALLEIRSLGYVCLSKDASGLS